MSFARPANLSAVSGRRQRIVWFAVIAALLGLRVTTAIPAVEDSHQAVVKQCAVHDKRPCIQGTQADFAPNAATATFALALASFDLPNLDSPTKAQNSSTCLYNRPPPLFT